MQKIYLLLRNNKQSGPFTRDEILQHALQGQDLIWIEGKSAGWRCPWEIPELNAELDKPASGLVSNDPSEAEKQPGRETIPVKPSPSRHIYISLPSGVSAPAVTEKNTRVAATPAQTVSETGDEMQESFEDRVVRMQLRVAAYHDKTELTENKEAVATKYTRSLDDIRAEYASWLHRQKGKKKRFAVKPVLAGLAGIAFIILVSIFILKKDAGSEAAVSSVNQQAQSAIQPSKEAMVPQYQATSRDQTKVRNSSSTKSPNPPDTKKQPVTRTIASRKNSTVKNNTPVKSNIPKTPVRKTVSKAASSTVLVSQKEAAQPKESVPLTHQVRVYGDHITAQKRKDGSVLQLTVQNNSRQVLKVVAVDVFYSDGKGRLLQKKTVYFSNLSPHRSLTLSAPGHKKATIVDYKLGLVSTDQGLFYAKQ